MISSILIVVSLAGCPMEPVENSSIDNAHELISHKAETGTLLFSKGDCLAVRVFSRSSYTHVATIVREENRLTVYDSMNGMGVRKLSLRDYLQSRGSDVIHLYHPVQPFDNQNSVCFRNHLEQELGKPYAVRHHWGGKRGKGIHCAEYMTDALQSCKIVHANHPANVSPGSLLEGITKYHIYNSGEVITLEAKQAAVTEQGGNRCHQLWIDTKICTRKCCHKLQGWFLCK